MEIGIHSTETTVSFEEKVFLEDEESPAFIRTIVEIVTDRGERLVIRLYSKNQISIDDKRVTSSEAAA